LSPCVHVILGCLIGDYDKAMEMYLRTSRLDLDDYNNDTEDGLHITSMAGTWMSVVKGFGGMRVKKDVVHFNPYLPTNWDSMSFKVRFRGASMDVKVSKSGIEVENLGNSAIEVMVRNSKLRIEAKATATA
jgi:maltose phosphorylase